MQYDYDFFVIGAGSGGVRASRMAASYGAKVAICEDRYLGGTCVNVGCVPKKLYVYASEYSAHFRDAEGFGWQASKPTFDWSTLRNNKTQEISRLNTVYEGILERAGVEIIEGRGKIIGPHQVEVDGRSFTAKHILIATGGWPFVPDIPGKEHVVDSNGIFDLPEFPRRLAVVGGGYIAVEFAGIFHGLGAKVSQIVRSEKILNGFDRQIADFAAGQIQQNGIDIRFNTEVAAIEKQPDGSLELSLNDGSQLTVDTVLFATGRKPNLDGLGLENVNVQFDEDGYIKVNDTFQTSEQSIYALGDVIGGIELTPVALAEGAALAAYLFNNQACQMDYSNIATTVFCQPNIGTVGMTEEQARAHSKNVLTFRSEFRAMKHTLGGSQERTLMKLLVDGDTDKVLGAHMVGDSAGEIMQGIAIAIKCGATKADFDATIGIHPTAAEEFVTMRTPANN